MTYDTESAATPEIRPHSFGEIFAQGWTLLPRTLPNAGLLALIVFIPFSWLIGTQLMQWLVKFAGMMASFNETTQQPDTAAATAFLMVSIIVFLLALVGVILFSFVQNAMVAASWEGYNGRTIAFGDMMREAGGRRLWYGVVQYFIITAITFMVNIVLSVIGFGIGGLLGPAAAQIVNWGATAALLYINVVTLLRTHQVMLESRGPWRGIIASITLVKGNWWKAFGLFLLLLIPVGIISIAAVFPAIQDVMAAVESSPGLLQAVQGGAGVEPDTAAIGRLYAIIGGAIQDWMFPLLGVISALGMMILTNGMTALYVDLRTRRGDFEALVDEDDIPL